LDSSSSWANNRLKYRNNINYFVENKPLTISNVDIMINGISFGKSTGEFQYRRGGVGVDK